MSLITFFTQKSNKFDENSGTHFDNAFSALSSQFFLLVKPYTSATYQEISLTYPFVYAGKCIYNLIHLVNGGLLLIPAIITNPLESTPKIVFGVLGEVTAFLTNLVNVVVSFINIMTRNLITLFSLSYKDTYELSDEDCFSETFSF